MLHSGSSYLSQSELVLTFGLGSTTKADSIEVQWPSGQVDKLSNVYAGQTITIQEGKGVVANRPYTKPLALAEMIRRTAGSHRSRRLLCVSCPLWLTSLCFDETSIAIAQSSVLAALGIFAATTQKAATSSPNPAEAAVSTISALPT